MTITDRRRALMGAKKGDILTPVSWIQAHGSPIDTGITVNNNVLLQMSIKRDGPNSPSATAPAEFSDGTTFMTKKTDNFTNDSKAFGEAYTPYVAKGKLKTFVIDGVNHRAQWATNTSDYFTATQFVQATQSMRIGLSSTPYFYWVKSFEDGVLVHHLLPYLKNGKPGLYDILTDEFHTVAEGGTDWTYG